jgi:hypothetical protein
MIGITANAAHVIAKWGGGSVHRQFQDIICVIEKFTLYNSKGEYLLTQNMPGFSKDTGYMGKRSEFLKLMCDGNYGGESLFLLHTSDRYSSLLKLRNDLSKRQGFDFREHLIV